MTQVTSTSSPKSGAIISYSKEYRMDQIEEVMAVHQVMVKGGMSMRMIAKQIGMSPSNHLMNILWTMADDGRIMARKKHYRPNIDSFVWFVSADRLGVVLDKVYGK